MVHTDNTVNELTGKLPTEYKGLSLARRIGRFAVFTLRARGPRVSRLALCPTNPPVLQARSLMTVSPWTLVMTDF